MALMSPTRTRAPLAEVNLNSLPDSRPQDTSANKSSALSKSAGNIDFNSTHLISSPYPEFANQLKLNELDTPYQLFAFALTVMKPIREDYAVAPYLETFNWNEVFALLRELCQKKGFVWKEISFYTVIFRSTLKENIDRNRLGLLDQKSHEEACQSGGLLKYWFGTTDSKQRNLATCLWRDHADAVAGGGGPWHKQARLAAREMYQRIDFHVHQLVVEDGAEMWRLEEYVK